MLSLFWSLATAGAQDLDRLAAGPDEATIRAHVSALSGASWAEVGDRAMRIESRHVDHADNAHAVGWIAEQLEAVEGLEVWTEDFLLEGETRANVVAELVGSEPELPAVLVTAHLDSTASASEGWDPAEDPAPGADDDASGVSAVLEAARLLAAEPGGWRRTLRFVLFNAEEVGLVGSEAYVVDALSRGEEIAVVLQLDPVGYNPGDAGLLWFSYDAVSAEHAEGVERLALELEEHLALPIRVDGIDEAAIGGDARSDHYPFWQAGIPALHFASFPQPPEYHTTDDEIEVVDPAFTAAVAGVVVAYAASVAEAGPPPQADAREGSRGCGAVSTHGRAVSALAVCVSALALISLARRRPSPRSGTTR